MPNIQQIRPGQLPRAIEWNALADDYNGGTIGRRGFPGRRLPESSGLVYVKNTSGSNRLRWDVMQLDDPLFTIDTAGEVSLIYAATTAASDATPVILQEAIPNGLVGIGRIFGHTLARIEQASLATDLFGTPNGTNHNLDAGSSGPIKLLAPPSTSADSVRPVLLGAAAEKLVCKSPGGGIAARSGNTVSSATCTVWKRATSTMSAGTQTVIVWNLSTTAVAATVFIVAAPTNIGYVAVWEDC